ncbi:glycoside hydrolase N-terminal domain-containing protein [Flavihumibacter rivuli]|uniref:glycosyl hydrolase family 95 catalytic domain-containing protein n=1 Tax=Flavihumibacter rivuli TaxID=2838156 RepID=UPI001BDE0A7B|nr:glycoside hydrolase N-terminal domain-containing protein [Flavihumibacter rivuli]ULQ55654.1 glycoside hydrolase N-terminal domain-containing protein [Flavihumibacter rivuli]
MSISIRSILIFLFFLLAEITSGQPKRHLFQPFPKRWDEGIPLGNGMLGALIWQKEDKLRFSLDRADLWDSRPMKGLHRNEFSYDWVYRQVLKKDYKIVQQYFDAPYDNEPAPTKIPGAALEINSAALGDIVQAELNLSTAISQVKWSSGTLLKTFVHATRPIGWFRFENLHQPFSLELVPPAYQAAVRNIADPVGGDDLGRLGYSQGTITRKNNAIVYSQKGWGDFAYEVSIQWTEVDSKTVEGVWTITRSPEVYSGFHLSLNGLAEELMKGYEAASRLHRDWWSRFWAQSDVRVPDSLVQHQWYMEQYKFGATARKNAPPISLQAIWTADNGRIPPWKGDFHHDLNTQLSYWPAYSGNHLGEAMGYLNYFEKNKENFKRYTKLYFGKEGIAVPGVTTLDGTEMGGWIQYSLSPTVSAWISHHYYLHWRYSMDRDFLKATAYPWIKGTARFLESITIIDTNGRRQLPISSSPEINDNSLDAWFLETTNYDLSLMKFNFKAAAELANELELADEADHWQQLHDQLPDYALSNKKELIVGPNYPFRESHRHFSNLMAIHPLGLINWDGSANEQTIIRNSLQQFDSIGPGNWCGYSYSWLANLKARAKDGAGALNALQIFARAFCSPNSFHLNGDQTKSGYSSFTYRPFTLEGNFAFAAGLQEMLLQSHAGYIEVMPAIPAEWKTVSFHTLRAEGAFLVSADKENGEIRSIEIFAEKENTLRLKMPSASYSISVNEKVTGQKREGNLLIVQCKAGGKIILKKT